MRAYSYKELLAKVQADYEISVETLHSLTGIPTETIENNPVSMKIERGITQDFQLSGMRQRESYHLGTVLAFLVEPPAIDADNYVKNHMLRLIEKFHISNEAIAKYTGCSTIKIELFLQDAGALPIEERY